VTGFEVLEHTADIGIRAAAPDLAGTLEQATIGLASVIGVWRPERPGGRRRPIEVEAADAGGVLVDWLDEVLYLHDCGPAALTEVTVESAWPREARGWVDLVPLEDDPDGIQVKAITYHRLKVEENADGWVAEVYVDV
jgi:SHS2 domain-containing protein